MGKLNDRRLLFCVEYIKDYNRTKAAKRAGYSEKTSYSEGNRLMKNVEVIKEIERLEAKRTNKEVVTARWILDKLRENVAKAMQEVQVLDKKGVPTGEYRYDGAVANKALELLGKHLNIFEQHQQAGAVKLPDFSHLVMTNVQGRLSSKKGD